MNEDDLIELKSACGLAHYDRTKPNYNIIIHRLTGFIHWLNSIPII